MHTNLHITLTPFRNESRVLKETESLFRSGFVRHVHIAALHEGELPEREELDRGRTVRRIRLSSRAWSRSLFVQVFKYVEFCARVVGLAMRERVTLVSVHSLALLPVGVLLKRICGAKLVYDTHELETETFGLAGVRQTLSRYVERFCIPSADLVIVVGYSIGDWYRTAYKLSNLVTVLNCPPYRVPVRGTRLHQSLGIPTAKRIVIYQGGLLKGRGIEDLLEVFAAADDGRHVFVCLGYGELEPLIQSYARSHANIFFHPAVSPSVVHEYTSTADVGVSYIDNGSLNDRLCLPNKLFEYIAAGLPVIVNDAPEVRRVVTERGVGIVLAELTPSSLAAALDEVTARSSLLSESLKRAAQVFSWERQEEVMMSGYYRHIGLTR